MSNHADWLDEWPEKFRLCMKKLAENLSYTAILKRDELSGASGARTFLAAPESIYGRPNPCIVKFGPDNVLKQDVEGAEIAKTHFAEAHYRIEDVKDNNVRCIAMLVAGGSGGKTFEDYYTETDDPQKIVNVVNTLFLSVLRRAELNLKPAQENVFGLYKFHNPDVMKCELRRVGDDIPTFVFWWEKAREKYSSSSYQLLSHGDIHSKNVIVADGKPYVIDFGRSSECHMMRDLAKFEREICLFLFLRESNDPLRDLEKIEIFNLPKDNEIKRKGIELQKAYMTIKCLRKLAEKSVLPNIDWKFEYFGALLVQFIFAAGNSKLSEPTRKAALKLAQKLRDQLEEKLDAPVIIPDDRLTKQREAVLGRLSYAFLRLDQLPSGGWSKTLPQWMEALWEGDNGKIQRNPAMRTKGGTDLTCYALYHYLAFLEKNLNSRDLADLLAVNHIAEQVRKNLTGKIGLGGGIEVGEVGRTPVPLRIRHTLIGLITFLLYGKANNYAIVAFDGIYDTTKYLIDNLKLWEHDYSHLFGMFAVLVKLVEMLQDNNYGKQFNPQQDKDKLITELFRVQPLMRSMLDFEVECEPCPDGTCRKYATVPFFKPYYNFWRMERSNFLMYFPFLITNDGQKLNDLIDPFIQTRCAQCLGQMLADIAIPFNSEDPVKSLVRYHRKPVEGLSQGDIVVRDWGLSAELAAILKLPAVSTLLCNENSMLTNVLETKLNALIAALLQTFDKYYKYPQIFKFTHGVSFGRYLQIVKPDSLCQSELRHLDESITKLCSKGVTENGLGELIKNDILAQAGNPKDIYVNAIKDMLVDKLESGEYTPDGNICFENDWERMVNDVVSTTTISFYDGHGGIEYPKRYGNSPIKTFVTRLDDVTVWESCKDKKALDVGCGPGQYAELLMEKGFKVELVDMSEKMLKMASERLRVSKPPPRDIYKLTDYFPEEEQFDLIFACAMMVHVPRNRARDVYGSFYQLLRPDGVLFVNFKLRDHTLISTDGRYYEYYRDHTLPMNMLKEAGFSIEELTLRWNRRNLYGDPKEIRWANFYCKKAKK